ncbi:MAG: SLBB domain-containing protein [Treponema sp.]
MKKIFLIICTFAVALSFGVSEENTTDKIPKESFTDIQIALSSPEYPVTAGDIYTLAFLANNTPVSYSISVDASYQIRIANLTVLDAKGKTFLELKKLVEKIVTENYRMSGVQFVLTTPAVFNVIIKGEVQETQTKKAWALSRLSSVISDFTTEYSSTRDITITSSDGKKKTCDLFKAERNGDLAQDPYLQPGDVVTINRISRIVTIAGAVERPGTYELLKGENIQELIKIYGGGLKEKADTSRARIVRSKDSVNLPGDEMYLTKKDFDNNFELLCFDSIIIPSYTDLMPVVFFEGAIYSKTNEELEASTRVALTFTPGENYATILRSNKDKFSASSDTKNAYIIRQGKQIPIDIDSLLYDASIYSPEYVQANDTLLVPFKQYFISVSGAVQKPGRYPYIPNRSWDYYVGLAGGFTTQNSFEKIQITDIYGKLLTKDDVITPETTIEAKSNSFLYYFNQYSGLISVALTCITTTLTVYAYLK